MLTKTFWIGESGVFVRAIRTFAQTALAGTVVGQTNLFTADIKNVLALATSAGLLSILMAVDRNSEPTKVVVETPVTEDPAATLSLSDDGLSINRFLADPAGAARRLHALAKQQSISDETQPLQAGYSDEK